MGDFDATMPVGPSNEDPSDRQNETRPGAGDSWNEDELPRIPGVDLRRRIGGGGMGEVFLGHQPYLDREVAVKLLGKGHRGKDFEKRFQREAKILAGMQHRNIVGCYQAGMTETGACFLVMEFIPGTDLRLWLDKFGCMPENQALELVRDLARALGHAYSAGIIHRDVKPENVLLKEDERAAPGSSFPYVVKLTDLGLARPARAADEATDMNLTMQGAVMGTPSTMAPEQFDDPDGIDHRADMYGLGCVLFHALTGRVAYHQSSINAIVSSKLRRPGPNPRQLNSSVSKGTSKLVQRLLDADKEKRPNTYDEIIRTCERLLRGGPSAPSPKVLAGVGGAAVVVVGGLAMILGGGDDGVNPDDSAPPVTSTPDPEDGTPKDPGTPSSASLAGLAASPPTTSGRPLAALLDARETETFRLPTLELPEGVRAEWTSRRGDLPLRDGALTLPQAAGAFDVPLQLTLRRDGESESSDWTLRVAAEDEPGRLEIDAPGRFQEPEGRKAGSYNITTRVEDPEGLPQEITYSMDVSEGGPPLEIFAVNDNVAVIRPIQWHAPYDLAVHVAAATKETGGGKVTDTINIQVDADDDPVHIFQTMGHREPVAVGDVVRLMAKARDPEGAEITYYWEPVDHAIPFVPDYEGAEGIEFEAPAEYAGQKIRFLVYAETDTSISEQHQVELEILEADGPAPVPFESVAFAAPLDGPTALLAEDANDAVVFAGWDLFAMAAPLGARERRLATSGFYSALQNEFAANLWANGKEDGYVSLSARRPLPEGTWTLDVEMLQNRVHEDPPSVAEGLGADAYGTGMRLEYADGTGLAVGLRNPLDRKQPNTLAVWQVSHTSEGWFDQPNTLRELGTLTKYQVYSLSLQTNGSNYQLSWSIEGESGGPAITVERPSAPHTLALFAKSARFYVRDLVLSPR